MSGDLFVRWGWLGVALNAVLVAANAAFLIAGTGGPLNWMAVCVCSASGGYCLVIWRAEVIRYGRYDR